MPNKLTSLRLMLPLGILLGLFLFAWNIKPERIIEPIRKTESGAGKALDAWAFVRAYPDKKISMRAFSLAFESKMREQQTSSRNLSMSPWEPMGPMNIGGRMLCLGINPLNPQTIYAGSASGGLWKTHTEGAGVVGWERMDLGHPVLGVGAISISPADTNVMYVGTGEVYNYQNTAPGIANRITRGSYGIGILKTTNGGQTWTKSLDWAYGDLRGVADLQINPLNPNTVFAATSEGLYRSRDAGDSWQLVHNILMAVDIEMHASDTTTVFVSHGNLGTAGSGIYRSQDGGTSFSKLTNGLPASYTGKSLLAISESNPNILYASVANTFISIGLYRSDDGGDSWTLKNTDDVAKYQGWYSHDVAIHPLHPDTIIYVGIETWKSTDGGTTLSQKSVWSSWDFGQTPVGGPEGPPYYVHADIHAAYFHPDNPDKSLLATDGGMFVSADVGENWEGRNGSFQATQFYANFSNSTSDSSLAIGGMQDNSTAVYLGGGSWRRVIGGDGLSAAINPINDNIIYGSYQYLGILKSTDRGVNFNQSVEPPELSGENTSFAGPFELAPSAPDVIFAGRERVYRSSNGGLGWTNVSGVPLDGGNPIISMAIGKSDISLLYAATAPLVAGPAKIFKSENGGASWLNVSASLPDRIATDIAFHPLDQDRIFVTFSGFGSSHVYLSPDAGLSWTPIDAGIPDVPANTICIDPMFPDHLYVGNDLGVYASTDAGLTWDVFCSGLPEAAMVMHLSISPSNRKLRVATHGNGVYQTPLLLAPVSALDTDLPAGIELGQNYPNPVAGKTTIPLLLENSTEIQLDLLDVQGRLIRKLIAKETRVGSQDIVVDLTQLPAGQYIYRMIVRESSSGKTFQATRNMIKR